MFSARKVFCLSLRYKSGTTSTSTFQCKRPPKKPFWLGLAKSKLFRIPKPKEYPPLEKEEYDRLEDIYNRQMLSLTAFTAEKAREAAKRAEEEKDTSESAQIDDDSYNAKWNAATAALREERLKRESIELEETLLRQRMEFEEKSEMIRNRVEEIVKAEIEISDTYVTEENIDSVIENCLANTKDYDFAIDLKGNVEMMYMS
ncbi:UNVERIFIED_CONTAM: hypothetical protein PYX00_007727 [Menopon gallinae]|uniref:Small ribosomal subunit protein mS26 n=1 Tax=Menopon gallinae TaxID=328185 RepID=A0AAW2HKI3_9NEOP